MSKELMAEKRALKIELHRYEECFKKGHEGRHPLKSDRSEAIAARYKRYTEIKMLLCGTDDEEEGRETATTTATSTSNPTCCLNPALVVVGGVHLDRSHPEHTEDVHHLDVEDHDSVHNSSFVSACTNKSFSICSSPSLLQAERAMLQREMEGKIVVGEKDGLGSS